MTYKIQGVIHDIRIRKSMRKSLDSDGFQMVSDFLLHKEYSVVNEFLLFERYQSAIFIDGNEGGAGKFIYVK